MKLTKLLPAWIFVAFVFSQGTANAQKSEQKLSLSEGTVENQFNYIIQKSDPFEDYRMVKSWQLYRLKTQVLDSLKFEKDKFIEARETIAIRDQEIVSLKSSLQTTNEKLNQAISQKNQLEFLGLKMSKATYNSILWIAITALATGLILYLILYRRSNAITVATKKSLSELKEEYEDYRKRTLEREQKTVRKLYDEILKYKNKGSKV